MMKNISLKKIIKNADKIREDGNLLKAIKEYDKALFKMKKEGAMDYSYDALYCLYSKAKSHGLIAYESDNFSEKEKSAHNKSGFEASKEALSLLPDTEIWHYTDEGQFQMEVLRFCGNYVAWYLKDAASSPNDPLLEEALAAINKSVGYIKTSEHLYVIDTKVRVLLVMNRIDDAYETSYRALLKNPKFEDLQDIAKSQQYLKWKVEKGYVETDNKKVSTTTLSDLKERMQFYDYAAFKKLGKISNIKGRDQYQIKYIVDELEDSGTEDPEGQQFALIDGDVKIDGNFFLDLLDDCDRELDLVWISGDLKVSETLYSKDPEHYYNNLAVEGNTHVKNVIVAGTNLYFLQDLKVDEIYYVKENAEGFGCTSGRKNIKIYAYNEQEWTIDNKQYDFYGYHPVDMSYEEAAEIIDRIFLKRFNFWASDDDKTGFFLEEDLFIDALLQGKKLFKEKFALPIEKYEDENDIQVWIKRGERAQKKDNYKKTIDYFTKVLEMEPENTQALNAIASAYYLTAFDYQCEVNSMAESYLPDGYEVEVKKFTSPRSIEPAKKAIPYFEMLFDKDPQIAGKKYEAYYLAGEAYELLGNKEKAIDYYSKQVEYTNDEHCKKQIEILQKGEPAPEMSQKHSWVTKLITKILLRRFKNYK